MEKPLVLFFLMLYCLSSNAFVKFEGCPKEYLPIGQSCYRFLTSSSTQSDSQLICQEDAATLLEIKDQNNLNAILNYVNDNNPGQYWVGGYFNPEKGYMWKTSSIPVQQSMRGRSFQGADQCVYLCSLTEKLWDGDCSHRKNFICQTDEEVVKRLPDIY